MQYKFTLELSTPGSVTSGLSRSETSPSLTIVGFADTDSVQNAVSSNLATIHKISVCSMVVAALTSAFPGSKKSGFQVGLAGFTGDGHQSTAPANAVPYREPAAPKILPVSDQLIYDKLCGIHGEAWFDIAVLTPAGIWNYNGFNSNNPVKVSWKPFPYNERHQGSSSFQTSLVANHPTVD